MADDEDDKKGTLEFKIVKNTPLTIKGENGNFEFTLDADKIPADANGIMVTVNKATRAVTVKGGKDDDVNKAIALDLLKKMGAAQVTIPQLRSGLEKAGIDVEETVPKKKPENKEENKEAAKPDPPDDRGKLRFKVEKDKPFKVNKYEFKPLGDSPHAIIELDKATGGVTVVEMDPAKKGHKKLEGSIEDAISDRIFSVADLRKALKKEGDIIFREDGHEKPAPEVKKAEARSAFMELLKRGSEGDQAAMAQMREKLGSLSKFGDAMQDSPLSAALNRLATDLRQPLKDKNGKLQFGADGKELGDPAPYKALYKKLETLKGTFKEGEEQVVKSMADGLLDSKDPGKNATGIAYIAFVNYPQANIRTRDDRMIGFLTTRNNMITAITQAATDSANNPIGPDKDILKLRVPERARNALEILKEGPPPPKKEGDKGEKMGSLDANGMDALKDRVAAAVSSAGPLITGMVDFGSGTGNSDDIAGVITGNVSRRGEIEI